MRTIMKTRTSLLFCALLAALTVPVPFEIKYNVKLSAVTDGVKLSPMLTGVRLIPSPPTISALSIPARTMAPTLVFSCSHHNTAPIAIPMPMIAKR